VAAADAGDADAAATAARTAAWLGGALGLRLGGDAAEEIDTATVGLVRRRDASRAAKDWARADALRTELEAAGWLVEDGSQGTRIRRR
jgi:cysteinyl-tRNA synthetase